MKQIVLTLTLVLLSPIFAIPKIVNPARSSPAIVAQGEDRYHYADGAGNLYIINLGSIEYRPITSAESSSGTYDGGTPQTVKINTRQYRKISAMLDRAINLKSIHLENANTGRAKGTGLISKRVTNRKFIIQVIAQNSGSKIEIEDLLKKLLSRQ